MLALSPGACSLHPPRSNPPCPSRLIYWAPPAFLSPGKPPHLLSALFPSPAPPRMTGSREQGSASCEDGVPLWLTLLRGATAWIEWGCLVAGLSFHLPALHRPVRRVQALLLHCQVPPPPHHKLAAWGRVSCCLAQQVPGSCRAPTLLTSALLQKGPCQPWGSSPTKD